MRRALPALIVVAALTAVTVVALTAMPAAAQAPRPTPVAYRPPVAAPVVEGFVAPATPYGPGHRGLAYGTGPATAVRAAAAGVVTFAGSVAGARHVTVLHADRVRTTYAFLATTAVGAGEAVDAGEVLGTSAGRLLWTARLGGAYLDPAVLLAASGHATVRLVPDQRPEVAGRSTPRGPVPAAAARWALDGSRVRHETELCCSVGLAPARPSPTPRPGSTHGRDHPVVPGPGFATDGKEGPWPP